MINIKTKDEIEKMRIAGKINYETFKTLESHIKEGVTTKELNDIAEKFIESKGCIPSFRNYQGFPGSICTSINEEVVHGIPKDRLLKNGDIISIDNGVIYKGYHSDSAWTYKVGKTSKEVDYLLEHTKEALYAGISQIKDGASLKSVSKAIETVAKKHKLGIVEELVGHGVGKNLHEEPDIPNYVDNSEDIILKEGMTLAIEPMLTLGKRHIWLLEDDWTIVTRDKKCAAHYEHTVLVTKKGYEILTGE